MKVLVTGGCGFIGSAVCRQLIACGDEVVNLDKLTYASTAGSTHGLRDTGRYTLVKGDVADEAAVAGVFAGHRPDAVIHLAAESHVDRSITEPGAFVHTNLVGTYVLLQSARAHWEALPDERRRAFRFLHVSTDEVYGTLGREGLFTEETAYDPRSPYSASKAGSDHLASAWFHTFGLPVVISNCSNNYGPFHFPEKLIPLVTLRLLEGREAPVYGDGSNVRDWLYVEDHARALRLVMMQGSPGETYNVGGRNERSNLQVVEALCDLLDEMAPRPGAAGRRDLIRFVTDRPGHDWRYAIDASKLERDLGWRAQENFESGLRKTVRWYLDNREWWEPLRAGYHEERLGLWKAERAGHGI